MSKIKYENEAVGLMRSSNIAILSTVSKKHQNYPFGSFITYISGQNRSLFVYASDLAEHTKNFTNDPKSCLTIFKVTNEDDKQNSSRLSIMGDFKKVKEKIDIELCQNRFFTFLPESRKYSKTHDFNFYKLDPKEIRWIGGFGEIAWLKDDFWKMSEPEWRNGELSMIEHMNEDHSDVVISCMKSLFNIDDNNAKMVGICIDGYYISSKSKIHYIPFDKPCLNAKQIREALVAHSKEFKK